MEFKKVARGRRKMFTNRKMVFSRLPEEIYNDLEKYSYRRGETKATVIKSAVEEKLKREGI